MWKRRKEALVVTLKGIVLFVNTHNPTKKLNVIDN